MNEPYQQPDGWWFAYAGDDVGPYTTKAEALDDLRGLRRFDRYKNEPGFITTDDNRRTAEVGDPPP